MNNDVKVINELKLLAIDMINRAKSGSPGIVLDMAPVMYTLFAKVLDVYPDKPNFFNRDRVILSSSLIAPLYYAMLHIAGYEIKKEDLMNFKRLGSITPGIPEVGTTPGVDASTAFAGDGIGIAVGTVLAKRYLNSLIKAEENKFNILTYTTYCFCSDADFTSGSSLEAFTFAAQEQLDKLVFLYDYNESTADGEYRGLKPEILQKQFTAMGYYVDILRDITNLREMNVMLNKATSCGKPALIIFKNKIGADSFNAGKNILHHGALSFDDTENIRKKFNSFLAPFEVSKDSQIYVQKQMKERTEKRYEKWYQHYNKAKNLMSSNLNLILSLLETGKTDIPFESSNYKINDGYRESLLETNAKIMNLFASKSPLFLGGSAGLALRTQTIIGTIDFQSPKSPLVQNINFGVRERAMANILNGMALSGLKVFGSTKLCYLDELKSGIRMSALMNLPVTYIFTHDSLYDSEDGPARIPCEQINTLRMIPNLTVFRPADINEVMGTWEYILASNKPASIVLTKNNVPKLPGSNSKEVLKGGYIIKKEDSRLDGIIIATGSEVVSSMQIAYDLRANGLDIRVISMPSLELFLSQGEEYRNLLLPKDVKTIVIEAGNSFCWGSFATSDEYILGINDFAYSGVPIEVLQKMDYDYESLKLKVETLLK